MANEIYVVIGTPLVWSSSGGDYALTMTSQATNSGRQGAEHTQGASPRGYRYIWELVTKFSTTPIIPEPIGIYMKRGDGTRYDNDDGIGDIAVSTIDKLSNCKFLDTLFVDEAATGVEMCKRGEVILYSPRIMPCIWNGTQDTLSATGTDTRFTLTPIAFQIQ